jgi:hypothetical protein
MGRLRRITTLGWEHVWRRHSWSILRLHEWIGLWRVWKLFEGPIIDRGLLIKKINLMQLIVVHWLERLIWCNWSLQFDSKDLFDGIDCHLSRSKINLTSLIIAYVWERSIWRAWSLSIDEKDWFDVIDPCLWMTKINLMSLIVAHWWERSIWCNRSPSINS